MVRGDINAYAAVIDHCEGPPMVARGQAKGTKDEGFWEMDFAIGWHMRIAKEPCIEDLRCFWLNWKLGMHICEYSHM
jgi:hypothetical protein